MTSQLPLKKLRQHADSHAYPLLFATISGAHLYGFPSADSDFDLRGAHLLPITDALGMGSMKETVDQTHVDDEGLELDLVTHDVLKFFRLMLRNNGYVLEQVFSPLVVQGSAEFEELREIAGDCITRHHSHHYIGFARNQWKLFAKAKVPLVKPLLYTYRVLMTGIHLMRSGKVESNIVKLSDSFDLPVIEDLVHQKVNGCEKEPVAESGFDHGRQVDELLELLERASTTSHLPEHATAKPALNDLLIRLRMQTLDQVSV